MLLYNSNVSLENCPNKILNVPLNFDEWDRMSPFYPDLDISLLPDRLKIYIVSLSSIMLSVTGS